MKLTVANTFAFKRLLRAALALAAGMLLGITIGQFLAPSASSRLAICLIFSVIVYRTQSYAAVVIIPMVAIATTAVVAQIVGLVISYQISFAWLAILVLLITAIMVLAWDSSIEKRVGVSDVLLLAVIAATLRYLTQQSTWDAKDALAAVSLMGVDNFAWLDGIARIVTRDAAFDSTRITHMGHVITIMASLLVGVTNGLGFLEGTLMDTAIVTLQVYWLLTAIITVISARVTYLLCCQYIGRLAAVPSSVAAVAVLPFAEGFVSAGHLTALFASTFILSSLLLLLERPVSETVTCLLALLLFLAAVDAYWPITGVVVIALGVTSLAMVARLWGGRTKYLRMWRGGSIARGWRSPSVWGSSILFGIAALYFGQQLFLLKNGFPSLSYLVGLLNVDGGRADVDPLLAVIMSLLAIVAASNIASSAHSQKLFGIIIVSSIMFPTVLIAYGFAYPPYAPQYAAYKALYLICLTITPVSIAGLTLALKRVTRSGSHAVVAVVVVALMGTATYLEPYPRLKRLLDKQPAAFWVEAAYKELTRDTNRLVMCLDTREQWVGMEAHVCSAQLAGIQGRVSTDTDVWTLTNICRATSAEVAALPEVFWQNLTLIVTDAERLVSTDECDRYGWAGPGLPDDERYPIGILSGVPWKVVRVIGPDGEEVKKSLHYLGGQVPEEVLDELERSLAG